MSAPGTFPEIHLTDSERALFLALYSAEGSTVTKCAIERALWPEPDDMPGDVDGGIKVRACRIRRKLRPAGAQINCIFGKGYILRRAPGVTFPWEGA